LIAEKRNSVKYSEIKMTDSYEMVYKKNARFKLYNNVLMQRLEKNVKYEAYEKDWLSLAEYA